MCLDNIALLHSDYCPENKLWGKVRVEAWKPIRRLLPPGRGAVGLDQSGSGVGKDGKIYDIC